MFSSILAPTFSALSIRKVGGLYHWRIGRVGGSLYLAKPLRKPSNSRRAARSIDWQSVIANRLHLYSQQ